MPRGRVAHGLFAALLIAALAQASLAAAETIPIDSQRSNAQFRVKAVWLFGVHGYFTHVGGRVELEPASGLAIVDARIDANAVRMNLRGYESWVRSAEFFDAARHPEIRFLSEPFPLGRFDDGGALPGTLTLRGISARVTFRLDAARCAQPGRACPIIAHAWIQRSAFGMRSRLGTLGDRVELSFEAWLEPPSSNAVR